MNNYIKSNEVSKKRINPFIVMGLVLSIILVALIFTAIDVKMSGNTAEAATQHATLSSWSTNTTYDGAAARSIELAKDKNLYNKKDKVTYNMSLTFSGNAGALYRNGAFKITYRVKFDSVTHKDYGGFSMSGPNMTTQTQGSKDGNWDIAKTSNVNAAGSGDGTTFKVNFSVWADDGTYWAPFKTYHYNTDTDVTCYAYIRLRQSDSTGPTASEVYTDNDANTWKSSKRVQIKLADSFAGVNPSTIKVNGSPINISSYYGSEDGRNVDFYYTTAASTLQVYAKDYLGNARTTTINLTKIDPTPPEIIKNLYAVGELGTTFWTNSNVELKATVKDANSGLKEFKVANTTKTYSSPASQTGNTTVSCTVSSNNTYTSYAKDHANNTRNLTSISITKIDKVAPTLTYYVPDAASWTNEDVMIYLNVAGVSSNDNTTGISPIRPTDPITISTSPASLYDPSITPETKTIGGFSYTHKCKLDSRNGQIEYRFRAYDKAGNASTEVKFTPKIDTTAPNISSISLTGKKADGTTVNAANHYSFTDITVTVVCNDVESGNQGLSGIESIIIKDGNTTIGTKTGDAPSYVFENIITKNTVQQSTYSITLKDHAGNYYQYDNDNGNGWENFREFKPLKDGETPDAKAIGSYDWQNADGAGQDIKAEVWVGLSGGRVDVRRTYLTGDGTTIATYIYDEAIDNIPTHTNLYDSSGNHTYTETPIKKISSEGEEYYHFRVTSNAGKSSGWKGLGGVTANTPTMTKTVVGSTDNWTFNSNGARTRIDNSRPDVINLFYANDPSGENTVGEDKFSNVNNYLSESIYGFFEINDGIRIDGAKTEGLGCSAEVVVNCTITYTDINDETKSITPTVGLITNDGEQLQYNGKWSKAKFRITFSNRDLADKARESIPIYTITITDKAGNSETIVKTPYIDDQELNLEIEFCEQLVSEVWENYDYRIEQNWTDKPIRFTLNKSFGPSGAKISWYIDTNKSAITPDPTSSDWKSSTSSTWGTITDDDTTETATVRIPLNNSFDAMIYFIIKSNAKDVNGNSPYSILATEKVVVPTNFYIAVDNNPPDIVSYEFRDDDGEGSKIIKEENKEDWSSKDVYLYVNVTDVPVETYTNNGSGVKDVVVETSGANPTEIPMEMVENNLWKSIERIGSNNYIIQIEDNVGHKSDKSKPRFKTFKPNIDKVPPTITVTAGTYDNLRGTPLIEATPIKNEVYITVSTSTILSGANVYYVERSKSAFGQTRYNTSNIDVDDSTQNWQLLSEIYEGEFSTPFIPVGDQQNAEVHNGYDFVIISGSGLMDHYEYGTIFVDKKAPQLIIEDIVYMRDGEEIDAGNIIVPDGDVGEWTNAPIIAKLKVSDGTIGSGINKNNVTLNNEEWDYTEGLDSHNNGFYIFELTEYVEYELKYEDYAGNSGSHTFKPLIDNAPVSISLSAIDEIGTTYIIDPSQGVVYTNQTVQIAITINYGLSSFKNTVEPDAFGVYSKGVDELYTLSYSLDGSNWFDINKEMGTSDQWINSDYDNSEFYFNSHNRNAANYTMKLSEDQNRRYYFRVRNGIEPKNVYDSGPSPVAVPYFQTENNVPQVKIDKTPPEIPKAEIQYVNAANDFETLEINEWTYKDIRVYFRIDDNEYGSGVLENDPKSVIVIKRNTNSTQDFIESIVPTKVDGLYNFVMDGHYNYYIEYEDNIGNGKRTDPFYLNDGEPAGKDGGMKGPILPLIDKVVPNFFSPITAESDDEDYIQPNGAHPWTSNAVTLNFETIVGLSGQYLQYQTRTYNNDAHPWSDWINVTSETTQNNGVVDPFYKDTTKNTTMIFNNDNDTYCYRFRVVSRSGLFCEIEVDGETQNYYEFGNILIDTYKPTIEVIAKSNNNTYDANNWTKDDIIFTIKVKNGRSGSTVEVSNNQSSWTTNDDILGRVNFSKVVSVQGNITTQEYTLIREYDSISYNGDNYYFKVTSGAKEEATQNFGRVKKDSGSSLNISTDSRKVSEEDIEYEGGGINYSATYAKGEVHSFGSWSSKYILVKLSVTVGNSGGEVMYSHGIEGIMGDYKDTDLKNNVIEITSSNDPKTVDVYLLIKENQDRQYKFKVASDSGVIKETILYDIRIDQTIPYMTLSIDEDKRSAKWIDDSVDDLHKWYTDKPKISFEIGHIDGEELKDGYPVSGATIYYKESYIDEAGERVIRTENNDGNIIMWFSNIQNNGGDDPTMTIAHNASLVKTYEFKIVTGAGLEFDIKAEYSDTNNTEGKDLWTKSLTSDEPGMYTIKVDTTEYSINIEQWLKGYGDLPSVTEDDMATIKINGAKSATSTANRGDNITVAIKEMPYDDGEGYGYIFKRVEFNGIELNAEGNEYVDEFQIINKENMTESEDGRIFEFDVFDKGYSIMGYFTKIIKLTYDDDTLDQKLQSQDEILPIGIQSPNSVDELEFNILYDDSEVVPEVVGEYDIKVTIKNDNPNEPNYVIYNDSEKLIIGYFENKGTDSAPIYWVNDYEELGYIAIYNDPDTFYNFLGASRTSATYIQKNNIEINQRTETNEIDEFQPIYGTFTGTYDGNDREIYSVNTINDEGVFGIFESISGTVKNLGIKISLLNVTNATNAGFLAGSATHATIENCYAIGEMHINGEYANIGGLIGQANDETMLNLIYTDIAMSNKGNALSGNVGGIVGLADNISIVYNYAIGAIEAYGINSSELNIGTLMGSILSTMEDEDLSNGNSLFYGNKYLLGNLFVNENIENNGGVGDLNENIYTSGTNEIEGLHFNRFVDEKAADNIPNADNIAKDVYIANKMIMTLATERIEDLGMEYGIGTINDPFQVDSKEALAFIDKYVWANYIQTADIIFGEDDEFETIAAHKVFTGEYNGLSSNTRYSINGINIITTDKNTGIFGKVSGTIKNLDVRDLNIEIYYEGSDVAYAGGITAILMPGAKLEMVYVVGNIVASSPNAKLYLGGITGYADGASLVDILSMANVKTIVAHSLDIGGTVGYMKNAIDSQKIYNLARVEGNYNNTGSVGALIGRLTGTNAFNESYALLGNTYAHGEIYDNLVGYMNGTGFQGYLYSFEEMRTSGLTFRTTQEYLSDVMQDLYPFADGNGTENNPFRIYTVADFNLISDFLYANYKLMNDITFDDSYEATKFKTIGVGARFTGSITGGMTATEYYDYNDGQDGPRSFKISGITDSLVYHNAGKILDLRVTIEYNKVHYTDVTFGAIAVYNSGTIQSINADGSIILRVNGNASAIVGGFVGHDLGGKYIPDFEGQEPSYEVSSINEINITVMAGQINAGGFVGRITGPTVLSYLISEGDINCYGGSVLAGTIAGAVLDTGMTFDNEIESTAVVSINNVQYDQLYGFNINP